MSEAAVAENTKQSARKISKKIISYSVFSDAERDAEVRRKNELSELARIESEKRSELMQRPEVLRGTTYKVKAPIIDSALYITINDIEIESNGVKAYHPFEIFINSKDMKDFQWIIALTRVISAVFRKGGDATFLVEELGSVFNPSGGYFKKGGKYMPSLVAEIGEVLRNHLVMLGLIEDPQLDEHQQALVDSKRAEVMPTKPAANESEEPESEGYPENAALCAKCNTKAVIKMDGCLTCLSCADSKCG